MQHRIIPQTSSAQVKTHHVRAKSSPTTCDQLYDMRCGHHISHVVWTIYDSAMFVFHTTAYARTTERSFTTVCEAPNGMKGTHRRVASVATTTTCHAVSVTLVVILESARVVLREITLKTANGGLQAPPIHKQQDATHAQHAADRVAPRYGGFIGFSVPNLNFPAPLFGTIVLRFLRRSL